MEGDVVAEIVSGNKGVERFNQYDDLSAEVTEMVKEQSHSLFGESYSAQLESTLMDTEALGAMLDGALLKAGDTNMPTDNLVCFYVWMCGCILFLLFPFFVLATFSTFSVLYAHSLLIPSP